MRKIFTLLILLTVSIGAFSQSPQKMSYQAIIRNANGELVRDNPIGMKISILQYSSEGSAVFSETHIKTSNVNGLINIEIGDGTPVIGSFSSIDWTYGPYFLKIETDITGGNSYTITGVSQILSVPYALHAQNADTATTYNENDPVFQYHPSSGISSGNISNWTSAYSWGNHSGLYRPIDYIPAWSEITGKPTTIGGYGILDAVTITGDQSVSGKKIFTGTIEVNTPVNESDAANKAYVDALKQELDDLKTLLNDYNVFTVTDIDGNAYSTVKIGNQIWMAENLKTSRFNDGEVIPYVESDLDWWSLVTPGYCWYEKDTYGALYNWYSINTSKLCPTGWHIPTDEEWTTLITWLGGEDIAGGKLKENGTLHWSDPNTGATNESGFTALPGGFRTGYDVYQGAIIHVGFAGYWWMAAEGPYTNSGHLSLHCDDDDVDKSNDISPEQGYSVRCIKD